jgi:phosphoserine phosphatase
MSAPSLYVDVDGTLIRSDLLVEGLFALIKQRPATLLLLPFWFLRGRAYMKAQIASRVTPPVHSLPYCEELLDWLRSEAENGRKIYLASASDQRYVQAIADHLGFFSGVLGTDARRNLKGSAKAEAILQHCSNTPFDYAGNDTPDVPIWRRAREGIVVNAGSGVENAARRVTNVTRVVPGPKRTLKSYLRCIRAHQWLKNVLVFVAAIASGMLFDTTVIVQSLATFVSFWTIASGTYLLNDLFDLAADR